MALQTGLDAKLIKLLNEVGCGEYLRLFYYFTGEVLGSGVRSIVSFINGEWESNVRAVNMEDV